MNGRTDTILKRVMEDDRVSIRELAEDFAVSDMTIRRDLDRLEDQGLVTRHYGGCAATDLLRARQSLPRTASTTNVRALIGETAAQLVSPGQTVLLDVGSTDYGVARQLPNDPSITVVTASLIVAQELQDSDLNVLLLGGLVRKRVPAACGPITEQQLSQFRVDVFITTCDGASSEDGFYLADVQHAGLQQAMMRVSGRIVVLSEAEKFTRRALVRYATVEDVHAVVSDPSISETNVQRLQERGVEVVLAPTRQFAVATL